MKNKIIKSLSFLLAFTFLVSLAGCKPEKKKNLVFESMVDIKNIDPQLAQNDTEFQIVYNTFEGLFKYDKKGEIVNGVIDSYITSKNNLKYTFEISDKAKWSNGKSVTADDFVFALQRAVDPKTKSPFSYTLLPIKNASKIIIGGSSSSNLGVFAKAEKTLVIELDYPINNLPKLFTTPITMPCNREFFESTKGYYGLNRKSILCNGFYKLQSWNTDYCSITTNEEYTTEFTPQITDVYFYLSNETELLESIEKDDVDISIFNNSTVDYLDENEVSYSTEKISDTVYSLVFNEKHATLNENIINVLKNTTSFNISENVSEKYGINKTNSIIPSIIKGYEYIAIENEFSYSNEEARSLFLDACKELETDRTFPPISIIYIDDPASNYVIKQIAANWQNIFGITINLESVSDKSGLYSAIKNNEYQIALVPSYAATDAAISYLNQFSNNSNLNNFNFKSSSFDRQLKKLFNSNNDQYLATLKKLIKSVNDSKYTKPIFSASKLYYIDSEIKIPINKSNKIIYFAFCK